MLDSRSLPLPASTLTHLQCSRPGCGMALNHAVRQNLCPSCHAPLLARYDLAAAAKTLSRDALRGRVHSMWRYAEVLPGATPVTLGEGMTPLLHAPRLGANWASSGCSSRTRGRTRPLLQGARAVGGRQRGEGARRGDDCAADGRQRGRRGRGLRGAGRACGCVIAMPADTPIAIVLESRGLRRRRAADRRADLRLRRVHRRRGAEARLVRGLDAEGAVPHRGQEDDGLRAVGGDRTGRCPT